MKKLELTTSISVLAAALMLTACGGGNGSSSEGRLGSVEEPGPEPTGSVEVCSGETTFTTTGFFPEDNATDVSVSTSVQVTFNTNIKASSVNDSSVFLSGGAASTVDAVLTVTANAVVINPTDRLEAGTVYTINVDTQVAADCAEVVTLENGASSLFTTASTNTGGGDTGGGDTGGGDTGGGDTGGGDTGGGDTGGGDTGGGDTGGGDTGGGDTGGDTGLPNVVVSTPDLMGLLPVELTLVVDFGEPLDSSSVDLDSIFVSPDGGNTKIDGIISFEGTTLTFTPSQPLSGEESFELFIPGLTTLPGSEFPAQEIPINIITEGLEAVLSDSGSNPLEGLQAALEDLGGNLFSQLPGGSDGGSGGAPDANAIFEIPLTFASLIAAGVEEAATLLGLPVGDFADPEAFLDNFGNLLDPSILTQLQTLFTEFTNDPANFNLLDEVNNAAGMGAPYDLVVLEIFPILVNGELTPDKLAEFSSVVVAVCDPKGNADGTDTACVLSVNLGVSQFTESLDPQAFADALTGGDIGALSDFIFKFTENGGLAAVSVLDDSALPLPTELEDPLVSLLNGIGQIPVLGSLVNQDDLAPLVDANLLNTAIIELNAGGLLELIVVPFDTVGSLINGETEAFTDLLQLDGELIDFLTGDLFNGLTGGDSNPVTDVVETITDGLTGGDSNPVTDVVETVTDGLSGGDSNPVTDVVETVTDGLTGGDSNPVTDVVETVTDGLTGGDSNPVTDALGGITDTLLGNAPTLGGGAFPPLPVINDLAASEQ